MIKVAQWSSVLPDFAILEVSNDSIFYYTNVSNLWAINCTQIILNKLLYIMF